MLVSSQRRGRLWLRAALLAVLLLAFVLRIYHLDFQSLWSDEGISLLRSAQPLPQMLRDMPVEHAPGYFVMLHFWQRASGDSDFALRFLSLFASVLAVAIVFRTGVDLGSQRAGLIAAFLVATNAFQVWYSQEGRMYSWLLATGAAATWLLWRLLDAPPGRARILAAIGYALSLAGAVYLHHYGFLLPLAHVVFMAGWYWAKRDRAGLARWAVAALAAALCYLPWLPRSLGIFDFPGWRPDMNPVDLPSQFFTAYTVGGAMPSPWSGWLPWLYLGLCLAGAWAWLRLDRTSGWLLICTAAVPVAGAFALAVRTADYHERYAIFVSAPVYLLAGGGVALLAGWQGGNDAKRSPLRLLLGAVMVAALIAANGAALYRHYSDPFLRKPDYRPMARRIEQLESPGDLILAARLDPEKVFAHYYAGDLPVHDVRRVEDASDADVDALLGPLTADADRVWLLRHDQGPVEYWLISRGWLVNRTAYDQGGLSLSLYMMPGQSGENRDFDLAFGPALKLSGVTIVGGEGIGDDLTFRAGDALALTTEWDVLDSPPELRFSLRLRDADGRTWLADDYVPQDGFAPTHRWQPGAPVTDRRGFLLPATLPPGHYEAFLMVYDAETGAPVPVEGQDGVVLAAFDVLPAPSPPDPDALPIAVRTDAPAAGPLELLGYDLGSQPLQTGVPSAATLWWRAHEDVNAPYTLLFEATNADGDVALQQSLPLRAPSEDSWRQGQVVSERYDLEADVAAQTGDYRIGVTLIGPDGNPVGPPIALGEIAVRARPRLYRLPRMEQTLDMRLGEDILLRGYDLDAPDDGGGEIGLDLVWQATERVTQPYKVFVHLVDADGAVVAQADDLPMGGVAPTESWLKGEVVVDRHTLRAPTPGHYSLRVGLYDPVTGERLPVRDQAGVPVPENAVSLPAFELPLRVDP